MILAVTVLIKMFFKRFYILITIALLTHFSSAMADGEIQYLSLQNTQQLFYENNRDLLAAKRLLQTAEADVITASQKPNPNLSLSLSSFNLNRSEANKNQSGNNGLLDQTLNSSIQISQLFERGNKRELRISSANDALTAAKYTFRNIERQLNLSLISTYYDLILAQEVEKIQLTNRQAYEKTINAAELRLKAGDLAASDVSRMRVDLLKTQNDLRQAKANREKVQVSLAYMIGQEGNAINIVAQDPWPAITNPQTAPQNLDHRPDVLAAEALTKQAEENQKLANALKTRDVNIALQYQHFPGQTPGAGDNTIGASVSIPLFTNYEYQGEIARAEVELTSAIEAKEQIGALALNEISRARADLASATEKVERFDTEILSEAKKAAEAAEFAYSHGATGITDLLDARRVLRGLQLDAANAHADYAKALAAWQAAIKTEEDTK